MNLFSDTMKPRRQIPSAKAAVFIFTVVIYHHPTVVFATKQEPKHEHTIPTLLSVVTDPHVQTEHGPLFVNALENPLYEMLKQVNFVSMEHDEEAGVLTMPRLWFDRNEIDIRNPLTLFWTLGSDQEGDPIVNDDDIFILHCDNDQPFEVDVWIESLNNQLPFLDAATVRQAKATSQINNEGNSRDENKWYFPSFPVLRHGVCRFSLFQRLEASTQNCKRNESVSKFLHLATSEPVYIQNGITAPTGIHLAFGDDLDEMVVQFQTGISGTPIVKYGLHKDSLHQSAAGTSHTYTASDMCQEPANQTEAGKFISPGMLHVVRLKGLQLNTTYSYRAGVKVNGTVQSWSDIFEFVSAPPVQKDSPAFSLIVYGDQGCPALGWGDGGVWTAAMTAREIDHGKNPVRAVHHFGDLAYAVGAAHVWDEWMNMISAFTTRVPLMAGVGNHEYDHTYGGGHGRDPSGEQSEAGYHPSWGNFRNDSGGECGVPTANHFTMPNSIDSNALFWYSFDLANVHTIMVSSEHDLAPGSLQYDWLLNDLKSVNRRDTPWLILELHRPLYESEKDPWDNRVGVERRAELEPILKQFQVDLVLAGHYHSYLRTCLGLYQSRCNQGGPLHITIGSAGAHLNNNALYPNAWTEKYIKQTFGYGRITVANASALHFEFIQAGSDQDPNAGRVLDEVWLQKKSPANGRLHQSEFEEKEGIATTTSNLRISQLQT